MTAPSKAQLETLPKWAQRHIENVKADRDATKKKLTLSLLKVERSEIAERNMRLELDRAKRRIAELQSKGC